VQDVLREVGAPLQPLLGRGKGEEKGSHGAAEAQWAD
jgi:hypothetical protein